MRLPITLEFDDSNVVGWVELTPEFQKIYEQRLIDAGVGSGNIFVLSPAYISDLPDDSKITKAELIGFGVIPASRAIRKKNNG